MGTEPYGGQSNVLDHIYRQAPYLHPGLRRVAEYVLEHPAQIRGLTVKQLATACGVTESSVTRFIKEIDVASYQDLKFAIAEALSASDKPEAGPEDRYVYENILPNDSHQTIAEKVASRTRQTLADTLQRLNMGELDRAVDALDQPGAIVFACMGSSGIAGEGGVMRFTRVGKKCLLFRDQSIQLMTSAIVEPRDVVMGISNSGRSTPVIECLRLAQGRGARTVAITSFGDSPLVKVADITLLTPTQSPPPGLDLYGEATTSVSAQLMILDVLYASYAARHFDQVFTFLEETYAAAIRDSRTK
jgi:DNA-binding MurR/RpiR family transcriptional regulator